MPDIIDFNVVEEPPAELAKLVGAYEPGIYFGMPEAEYHADKSLGASGAKALAVSPLTYWMTSAFNPNLVDDPSDAAARGKAFHTRLLEGAGNFALRYAIAPDIADYPDAIDGAKALAKHCEELGLAKGGTIAELCARIRTKDQDVVLWPEVVARFERESAGLKIIKPKLALEIERHARIVERHIDTEKAFRGGYSEVSVFWRDPQTGVPLKARVDYLKVRAGVEIKTFSNPFNMPLDLAVGRTMANQRYAIDAVMRLAGIERAKAMYRQHGARILHGDAPPREWLDLFANPAIHAFVFVFLEAGDVPNVRVREFRRFETAPSEGNRGSENAYWTAGEGGARHAIALYKQCLEHYGVELPWIDPQAMRPFRDEDFPLWALE